MFVCAGILAGIEPGSRRIISGRVITRGGNESLRRRDVCVSSFANEFSSNCESLVTGLFHNLLPSDDGCLRNFRNLPWSSPREAFAEIFEEYKIFPPGAVALLPLHLPAIRWGISQISRRYVMEIRNTKKYEDYTERGQKWEKVRKSNIINMIKLYPWLFALTLSRE